MSLPEAWAPAEAEWVPLAPGVKWLLRRPNGVDEKVVSAEVAQAMAKVYSGRAALDLLGVDLEEDGGEALDLEKIAARASVFSAMLTAVRCLQGWNLVHPKTLEPIDYSDRENIRAALIHGAPPEGVPLLAPFLSWIEKPRRPMAAEVMRMRHRAKDWWTGGAARCLACKDEGDVCSEGGSVEGALCPQIEGEAQTFEGQLCWSLLTVTPGLWARAGMSGTITGLKYHDALIAFETHCANENTDADLKAAFELFRAIEGGCLEAMAEKAKDDQKT